MNNKEIINEITEKIKENFHPQKVILFGSYAWGNPAEDSDFVLFLIMESDLRRDKRSRQVQKIFSDRIFPMDIIVYTPSEVKECLEKDSPFIKEILNKEVTLYVQETY
ncbi:MAG: nucleotidyltransferase domain-containing protein [Candidatus Ancaeobacter aquaticus]|nr:nucleotidyltransferase domain-containing protein [Candidatus Ancaeobacter aquaticus]